MERGLVDTLGDVKRDIGSFESAPHEIHADDGEKANPFST